MSYKRHKKIISFLMVICILSGFFGILSQWTPVEAAKSISDYEDEIAALEKKQEEIDGKLNENTGLIEDEKEKQALLDAQITNMKKQIELSQEKIDLIMIDINTKLQEIETKLIEIDENEELFAQRVKAMYISNTSSSTLSTLLSAKSFAQFLNNAEILKRVSESDRDLIATLSRQKKELDEAKLVLEQRQAEEKETKAEFEKKTADLDIRLKASKAYEAELLQIEKQYLADKKKNQTEINAQQSAIDEIIASLDTNTEGPEGELKWPVPTSRRITSPFGWRWLWNERDFHTGIDIANPSGTPIVAAASGTVILVKYSDVGYGYHLAIDHGGGYVTLYAHNSRIDVAVGQKVQQGEVISRMGTTGNSTGNHLHFEVRVNGVQMDPMLYVIPPANI